MIEKILIMKLEVSNEMDVMLAHRRAMQFAKFSGIGLAEQTRFATAVSEITRNAQEHAREGIISFFITQDTVTNDSTLTAEIADRGAGIDEVKAILSRNPDLHRGRGLGMVYAQRLADELDINTGSDGTLVKISKKIPAKNSRFSRLVIDGWSKHVQVEPVVSAYEELKVRNMQLVDLTEQLQANNNLIDTQLRKIGELNTILSENNERMKEFTYAISHDLKNPLSSLKLATDHLVNHSVDADTSIFVGVLSRSVSRLDKTIHSLIEILDVQHQKQPPSKRISFQGILDGAIEEFQETIRDTGTEIRSDFAAADTVNYIEAYVRSLIHNLVSNSLKYRDPQRPLKISIRTKPDKGHVVVVFTDNGSGMDLAKIGHRIFQPFNRFTTTAEGKGIGLYLIRSMIENNGGSVSVESKVGEGTSFSFSLVPYD